MYRSLQTAKFGLGFEMRDRGSDFSWVSRDTRQQMKLRIADTAKAEEIWVDGKSWDFEDFSEFHRAHGYDSCLFSWSLFVILLHVKCIQYINLKLLHTFVTFI